MHLTKPLSFLAKQMTKTAIRSTALATLGLILLAGGVLTAQNLLVSPQTAQAATPPDSCFAFNAGTGTITDYYDHEGNNSANPACTRAVDIPATIGGVSVVRVGDYAFYNNQLTTVTIPSSVTSIGDYAFQANQLTSVTIGCGISTLGEHVFAINKLTEVSIPNCITSIDPTAFFGQNPWGGVVDTGSDPAHDWYSDDPAVRQLVFDNI